MKNLRESCIHFFKIISVASNNLNNFDNLNGGLEWNNLNNLNNLNGGLDFSYLNYLDNLIIYIIQII